MRNRTVIALALAGASTGFAAERLEDGKRNYEAICASCHETGVEGAPVVGRPDDWSNRSPLWEAVLMEHANDGYIRMPARGASDYATEYDVKSAAEYMLYLTYPELPTD